MVTHTDKFWGKNADEDIDLAVNNTCAIGGAEGFAYLERSLDASKVDSFVFMLSSLKDQAISIGLR